MKLRAVLVAFSDLNVRRSITLADERGVVAPIVTPVVAPVATPVVAPVVAC